MNVALRLARPPDQMDARPRPLCLQVPKGCQGTSRDAGAQDAARSPTAKPAEEPLPQKEQEANAKPDQEPQEKDEGDGGFYDGMPSTTVTTVADHGISTAEPWFLRDGSGASSSVYVDV